MKSNIKGHLTALITIMVWGTTFIATKLLLVDFTPIEILFVRFVIGLAALFAVYPRRLKVAERKRELYFAAAGLCGVTLYYLMENIALTFTSTSNVSVIMSCAPFFTAMLNARLGGNKPKANFYIGFAAAMAGIALISFNGSAVLKLNPLGDLLALGSASVWAVYAILSKKIAEFGYNTIQVTRRIFMYGLAFMTPALFIFGFELGIERFARPDVLFNILFLGLCASAMCFVTWNLAVKLLGAVKTSIYIYATPVVTVVTSLIVLGERITWISALGIALTLAGLILSEKRAKM